MSDLVGNPEDCFFHNKAHKLFSISDLSLAKTRITNVVKAITIKDTDSINVETTSVANVDYLIYAEYLNRNLSISFQSSNLDLVRQAVFVTLNYTEDINIALFDTSVTGPGIDGILRIVDARGRPGDVLTTVDLHIENSTIDTEHRYSRFIYVESCQVHFNFVSSLNSFKTKSDNVYVNSQSANFDVFGNQFLRGNQAFNLWFCQKTFEDDSRNRTINIHNNSFTLYSTSDVVQYITYYGQEHVHTFNIYGNVFKQSKFGYGHGLFYQSNSYIHIGHDIHITNNLFEGYLTSINIYGWAKNVSITGNTFLNNSEVLVLDQRDNYAENVSFSSNIIQGNHDRVNNAAGGLLQLKPYRGDSVVRIELIGNVFENNTKTLITTPSPNVLIRHNVLANRNATYSLEVLKDRGYTSANNEVLNASLNYWGSKDVKTIASKIYDNDYDNALFDVVFRPYLGSRNISDIQNKEAGFIDQNGEIGGSLNENITLAADGSPYMVINNIEVEEQGVLVLEAGVTLLFKASQGMSVIGK